MLRFNEGQIDIVVLDISLGAEDGWQVFHALREQRPELPIIVTSARADELAHSSAKRASAVLEKPFDITILLGLLKQYSQPANGHPVLGQENAGGRPRSRPRSGSRKTKDLT
jgi:DNA-binding response OmpR family regulator